MAGVVYFRTGSQSVHLVGSMHQFNTLMVFTDAGIDSDVGKSGCILTRRSGVSSFSAAETSATGMGSAMPLDVSTKFWCTQRLGD